MARRIKELPEVQTFLQKYPHATIENNANSGISAHYSFGYAIPYPHLEKGIGLGISLSAYITKTPDEKRIQAGELKQFGEYYYSVALYCGPARLDDPERGWFPDRLRQKSAEPCENEIRAINVTK